MKKQINFLAISILFLMTLSSCTKFKKNVTIEGRVENPITGEGISGVELWLLKSGSITEYYGGYERVTTVYTAADGSFKVDLKSAKAEILRLGDMHGEYYKIGWYQNGTQLPSDLPVEKGKTMHADFYAVPYGELKLDINNVNCQGVTDTMWFRNKWLGYTGFESSYSTPRTGCYSYTSASPIKIPIGTYIYETKVKRSGNITFVYDTVTVNETGVSTIYIDY